MTDGGERHCAAEDELLHHQKSTFPGLRAAARRLGNAKSKYSTHDIAKGTGFTIFTGITGEAWADAAVRVADRLGIQLKAVVIGEGREVQDLYGDWLRQRKSWRMVSSWSVRTSTSAGVPTPWFRIRKQP